MKTTDVKQTEELRQLEALYREWSAKRPTDEAGRAEQRMELANIAWAMDRERDNADESQEVDVCCVCGDAMPIGSTCCGQTVGPVGA